MNKRAEHAWEYLGEIVASCFLLIALNRLIRIGEMAAWLVRQQSPLANLLVVAAAATAITFAAFFAVLTTDFGLALRRAGEAKEYVTAFGYPLLLFVATLGLLSLGNSNWGSFYTELVVFFLIYSALNFVSMVKNVIDLAGLWQDVDRARKDGKRPEG